MTEEYSVKGKERYACQSSRISRRICHPQQLWHWRCQKSGYLGGGARYGTRREKFKIDEGWEQDDNIPLGIHDDWDLKYRGKDPKHQDLKF